jgi:hypothetical protein
VIMPQKFILEIDLGNEAMKTDDQVAEHLEHVAARLKQYGFGTGEHPIRDINGNVVEQYEIEMGTEEGY